MKKYIVEFIGTFFLAVAALLGGGMAAAVALMVMIYAGAHVSGGHYNPAVTGAVFLRGRINLADAIAYVIAQVAGALLAMVVLYVMRDGVPSQEGLNDMNFLKGFLAEILGTFALAYVVLNVATTKGTQGNQYFGAAIGLTILAVGSSLGGYSGGAFNPAVGIAMAAGVTVKWFMLFAYVTAPFIGAAGAAIVVNFLNDEAMPKFVTTPKPTPAPAPPADQGNG